LLSEYFLWCEKEEKISSISKAGNISSEYLEGAGAVFVGKSVEVKNVDYEQILDEFDKMLEIYIRVNIGSFDANYESLKNYEPPPKPKQISEWGEETIKGTEKALEELTFGINPIYGGVCLKRNDGTFGHISVGNAFKHNYLVVDNDDKTESFLTVQDLTKAGWVLD
jgi:hypothetical protein